jgi:hypothetical protein
MGHHVGVSGDPQLIERMRPAILICPDQYGLAVRVFQQRDLGSISTRYVTE